MRHYGSILLAIIILAVFGAGIYFGYTLGNDAGIKDGAVAGKKILATQIYQAALKGQQISVGGVILKATNLKEVKAEIAKKNAEELKGE